jgi:hypothetical protein
MSKVFISFLGMNDYSSIKYDNGTLSETRYVQSAIVEKHGNLFDKIRILVTEESYDKNGAMLKDELDKKLAPGFDFKFVKISGDLINNQWKWFETVMDQVDFNDEVWFDMTHGYRAFSIILSAALSFIQKTKNIQLMAVYYGAFDAPGKPIIDMKDFYQINQWADGVSQLIESADTSKLAMLSENTSIDTFSAFRDKSLISALNDLSHIIRNVDVNHIAEKADRALTLIAEKQKSCTGADSQLLSLVTEKFSSLAQSSPVTGTYDSAYFSTQLNFIEILNRHGLYMQAFTVMRELIGSTGMLGAKEKYKRKMDCDDGRKGRKAADVFVNMVRYQEKDWDFKYENKVFMEELKPFFDTLSDLGVVEKLRGIIKTILDLRNGFDHCWTSAGPEKRKLLQEVQVNAENCHKILVQIIGELRENQIICE